MGGGSNTFNDGDIGAFSLNIGGATYNNCAKITDASTIQSARNDAFNFSDTLSLLTPDTIFNSSTSSQSISLSQSGLNVISVLNYLPRSITGSASDTVILNVLTSGTLYAYNLNLSGGLLAENVIINYLNATEVVVSGNLTGTYIIRNGSLSWGAGSRTLNGSPHRLWGYNSRWRL